MGHRRSTPEQRLLCLLAGEAAEVVLCSGHSRGEFRVPWLPDALGQLRISDLTTDRIDVHTAASQINDDHAEIERLVTLAWTQAKEFVRKHEGAIRELGGLLARVGTLSEIEVAVYLNRQFPEIRNPPFAPVAQRAARDRQEIVPLELELMAGWAADLSPGL